jgi:hypothetical protein
MKLKRLNAFSKRRVGYWQPKAMTTLDEAPGSLDHELTVAGGRLQEPSTGQIDVLGPPSRIQEKTDDLRSGVHTATFMDLFDIPINADRRLEFCGEPVYGQNSETQ